jgi:ribonuclease HI
MDILEVYTDGSYSTNTPDFVGWAWIASNALVEKSGVLTGDAVKIRQVSGELKAVINAINYALLHNYKGIKIHYDYDGIEKWFDGSWKAKNFYTESYRDFMLRVANRIKIEFVKVKAHSGDKMNDMADELAKLAISK